MGTENTRGRKISKEFLSTLVDLNCSTTATQPLKVIILSNRVKEQTSSFFILKNKIALYPNWVKNQCFAFQKGFLTKNCNQIYFSSKMHFCCLEKNSIDFFKQHANVLELQTIQNSNFLKIKTAQCTQFVFQRNSVKL